MSLPLTNAVAPARLDVSRRTAPVRPTLARRALGLGLAALMGGCAAPLPPLSWVRLPAVPPAMVGPAVHGADIGAPVWQLMAPVALPGHLDRDALLVPRGTAALGALSGVRWAEPLRDAVPRLLRQDMAAQLGSPLWAAPLPPGLRPTLQLRIEFTALDVAASGQAVALAAQWSLSRVDGSAAPRVHQAQFTIQAADGSAEALAVAHRQALWDLAGRIAASSRP